ERRRFGVHVDGQLERNALDGLDMTVWKGSIAGDEHSQVMLGFSTHGSRGWIRTRTELVHLLAAPAADGTWRAASGVLVTERHLNALGHTYDGDCSARPPAVPPVPGAADPAPPTGALRTIDSIGLRECTIAMETDWQLYQLFNDVNAATTYLTTLLSFISDRYETQASTVLTFPYLQIYTTSNDPWSTPDNGGNSIDMLNEFRAAWQGNVPMGATLGHMMSGAGLGGGVAWLDVLCNNSFNFAVSGNIGGSVSFPVVQQPSNWDFMVVAHELGHNFSSPHTHDFCPPLDQCAPSGYFGQCQSSQQCTNMGTIMSYCHLCSGGTGNITTFFHPEAAALMTNASAACNPAVFEVIVDAPDVVSDTAPTQTMLQVTTGAITSPVLNHRIAGAPSFTQVAMTAMGGGAFIADIPPVPCGDTVEYWFEFDVTGIGATVAPTGAPASLYDAVGGFDQILFADDFESDLGWQATNLGASTGAWERGVPVNDSGWSYDPVSDFDGSGSCFLTENQNGNTDIDGGAVELVSPTFDMSAAGATVSYAYYLYLTNEDGADRILVEASVGGGPWAEVTRHDSNAGLAWRTATLTGADFLAAGITPGADTQLRFTANDGDPQSIVEAGLDAFQVSYIDCGGLGTNYCDPANGNSTGVPATISAEGSDVASDNDVTLTADSLPTNATGFFLTSTTQGFIPNAGGSSGNLCLGGSIGRYVGPGQVQSSGTAGSYSLDLDLTQTPQPNGLVSVVAGQTWNFQSWYRDSFGGVPTSNFTDAVEIVFQ
ncbi:MAG: zinc-dependent metalloprotease, partial [Planctomycetota bacterium]